jgi:hypothetical protein
MLAVECAMLQAKSPPIFVTGKQWLNVPAYDAKASCGDLSVVVEDDA